MLPERLSHALMNLVWSFLLLHFLLTPLASLTGYSILLDFNTRISPNDAYAGTYYFWWTNLTYLPLFFFAIVLLLLLCCSRPYFRAYCLLTVLAYTLYPLELVDYLALNAHYGTTTYGAYALNTLLTNTMNRYHPLIFYVSTSLLALAISFAYALRGNFVPFIHPASLTLSIKIGWLALIVNLSALWMGSWWALQEGTWGGWWNWDASETFGLAISLLILWTTHSRSSISNRSPLAIKSTLSLYFVTLSYYFIQLNFDLTSHNFGAKFFFFFNNNLFFLEALALALVLIVTNVMLLNWNSWKVHLFNLRLTTYSPLTLRFVKLVAPALALFWVVWSYRPLINYFLWNFASVNVVNFELSLQPANFIALILLWLWVTRLTSAIVAIFVALALVLGNWLWALLLPLSMSSKFNLLHSSLLVLSVLNISLYDLTCTSWLCDSTHSYLLSHGNLVVEQSNLYSLDSTAVETVKTWTSFILMNSASWNLIASANSPSVNFFTLGFSHSFFDNYYYLSLVYVNAYLWLELPLIGTLNTLFWCSVILARLLIWQRNLSQSL